MADEFFQKKWCIESLQSINGLDDSHVVGRLGPHSGQRFYNEGAFEAQTVSFARVSDCCRLLRLLPVVY